MGFDLSSLFGGGSAGWFNSNSASENTTANTSTTQNQQSAVQGNVGTFIAPGSTVTGLTGSEVQGLLDTLSASEAAGQKAIADVGSSLASGLQTQSQELAQIVAATKTPDSNTITQLLPVLIIGLVIWGITRG